MDGTVTMQDPTVKCGSCNHFGESCANTNPDSQVGDCNEYEPIKTFVSPDICRSCSRRNRNNCIPNSNEYCVDHTPDYLDTGATVSTSTEDVSNETTAKTFLNYPPYTPAGEVPAITKPDMVNHPNHYTQGGIECIKAIEASMPPDGFQDYCKGNVIKYTWRFRQKNGLEDLKKARVYLNWMIESVEKECGNAST